MSFRALGGVKHFSLSRRVSRGRQCLHAPSKQTAFRQKEAGKTNGLNSVAGQARPRPSAVARPAPGSRLPAPSSCHRRCHPAPCCTVTRQSVLHIEGRLSSQLTRLAARRVCAPLLPEAPWRAAWGFCVHGRNAVCSQGSS